jgi:hypothetical protein
MDLSNLAEGRGIPYLKHAVTGIPVLFQVLPAVKHEERVLQTRNILGDNVAKRLSPEPHSLIFWLVASGALAVFGVWWVGFYLLHRREGNFFFDPQDCAASAPKSRVLPLSAKDATFEPLLKHYIGVTQLIFTVAAASIAFGGSGQTCNAPVVIAKLILAWSISYGVLFCALLLWRYDEYGQNMNSLTAGWYSTIFGFGFSSLSCFIIGYLVWGFGL